MKIKIHPMLGMWIGQVLFLITAIYTGYDTYLDYQANDIDGATWGGFNTGMYACTSLYYFLLIFAMKNRNAMARRNEILTNELHNLRREQLNGLIDETFKEN